LRTTGKEIDKNDENYETIKMWDTHEKINNGCTQYYNPSQHVAVVDKLTVLFKTRAVFDQYIKKNTQTFWHQIFQIV
jgi:hypothetical protein